MCGDFLARGALLRMDVVRGHEGHTARRVPDYGEDESRERV
jgi:hypothetical protein